MGSTLHHHRMVTGRYGVFVYNMHDHYLGQALEYYGEYGEHEVSFIRQIVKPHQVVWDIGANIGALTVPLAQMVGKLGLVIAFEPQPEVFHLLAANIALNGLSQARALPFALSDQNGVLTLPAVDYGRAGNFGGVSLLNANENSVHQVECRRIDDLGYLPIPQFIKIDVEGMEQLVLRGAEQFLRQHQPILYCENDRVEKSPDLIACLWELGYRLFWHIPHLYNPDNYFQYSSNVYGNVASFNMLCLPSTNKAVVQLTEITDKDAHPLKR